MAGIYDRVSSVLKRATGPLYYYARAIYEVLYDIPTENPEDTPDGIRPQWKITIINHTDQDGRDGRAVKVILFQTPSERSCLAESEYYSCVWKRCTVPFPGRVGPIILSSEIQVYVVDKDDQGVPREAGPYDIEPNDEVKVTQQDDQSESSVKIEKNAHQDGKIRATNSKNNAKALEMAFFKNGKKIISCQNVVPNNTVAVDIKSAIFIVKAIGDKVVEIVSKDDFQRSEEFQLHPGKPDVEIGIYQLPSGQIDFKEVKKRAGEEELSHYGKSAEGMQPQEL